jgi:Flp pilus assembly protein TadB
VCYSATLRICACFRWHDKFEKQRQQLQSTGGQQQQQQPQANSNASTLQGQQQSQQQTNETQQQQPQHHSKQGRFAAAVQYTQLAVVLAALILWPAATQPGGLYCLRVWLLYLVYFNFFAASVARNLKHGPLTDRYDAPRSCHVTHPCAAVLQHVAHLPLHRIWLGAPPCC